MFVHFIRRMICDELTMNRSNKFQFYLKYCVLIAINLITFAEVNIQIYTTLMMSVASSNSAGMPYQLMHMSTVLLMMQKFIKSAK